MRKLILGTFISTFLFIASIGATTLVDVYEVEYGDKWSFPNLGVVYTDTGGSLQKQSELDSIWKILVHEDGLHKNEKGAKLVVKSPDLDFKKYTAIWYTGGAYRPVEVKLLRVEDTPEGLKVVIEETVTYGKPIRFFLWLVKKTTKPIYFELIEKTESPLGEQETKRIYTPIGALPSR